MRVGIFTESYEPLRNGVATSVRTLVDELRAQRHNVCIIAPHFPDHIDDSPFVLRVPSILTRMNADYPVPYPWFPRLRTEIANLNLDVLHSQSPWFLGLLAARVAKRYGIPHVSTYHTLYHTYAHYVFFLPSPATHGLLEWWMPEFYNDCDCVIVPSAVAEQALRSYGVISEIAIIPTGVPLPAPVALTEFAKQSARQRFDIPAEAPLLLYVGRLAREKNLELVLESFGSLAPEIPDLRLLVIGDGPHAASCRRMAGRLPGGDRIVFAGAVPRAELDPIYAAADLFVFGSTTETQGLVVSEARAAGTPSVVVDQGGASENVENDVDGVVVPADRDAMAAVIRQLLLEPIRSRLMSERCLMNANKYTPEAMAARVAEVYERVRRPMAQQMVLAGIR